MKMRPFTRLVPVGTAMGRLLRAVHPVEGEETVALSDALGRVAATTCRAAAAVPPFSRATWDGYAFDHRSTAGASAGRPARLTLVGEVYAEGAFDRRVGRGEAVAIATGAPLPPGTDSVIIFEEVRVEDGAVVVPRPVRPGERRAGPGEDFPKGSVVVRKGTVLSPADVAGLAATGAVAATVRLRPTVPILPNGNELTPPGVPLGPGRIYETNNLTLSAAVHAAGGVPMPLPPLPDDADQIESAVRRALTVGDLVLVTGGSSVGERDYLPTVFPRLGRLLFHGIAVRPGKPTLAVQVGRKVVLGLPGHPTSCLSNGFWMLLPALRRVAGLPGPGWIDGSARMAEGYALPPSEFATVVPLRVDRGRARPTFRDSSAISSLSGANAFLLLRPRSRGLVRGERVALHVLLPPMAVPPMPSGPLP